MSASASPTLSPTIPPASGASNGFTAERFAAHLEQHRQLPAWWLETKRAAWEQFQALPLPVRTNELWRFSNLAGIRLDGYELPEDRAPATVPPVPAFAHAGKLVFANGHLADRVPVSAEWAARGVIFCPLEEALRDHGDLVRAYFQKHPTNLGSEKFIALNTALTTSGAFLYVPKGVEIAEPFFVAHTVSGPSKAVFPHTIAVLAEHAKATVAEFFVGADSSAHLAAGVNDLHADAGAQLTYIGAQTWSRDTLSFQTNSIAVERDARVVSLSVHLGGRQSRHESHSRLLGPGAHSEMLALTVARGAQEFDQRTLQTHVAPNATSNLLYKNALLDSARTIFSGLIVVEPEAQKTDAYQSNRNLMLSADAESNSLPGLEIQANDVRCTHGSTTSRIDPEQEFDLQSRGIAQPAAVELLTFGFFEEVLAKLDHAPLHDALYELIQSSFGK
jgi:Fe-S cluster assembly protein SufD